MKKKLSIFSILFILVVTSARGPESMAEKILHTPPKIIRTCCAFGSDLKASFIPFKKFTDITEIDKVGHHVFLGDKEEGNGIIYTKKGGFIDLAHLRDIADWTAYLHHQIKLSKGKTTILPLGREGGKKTLRLNIPTAVTEKQMTLLAGQIAFDLSNWHEIGTWFGTSFIPFVPERYSAFSPEDQYSNLMGANLGIEAIQSGQPFELSMTTLIDELLTDLEAVPTREKTLAAMESVVGDWWTREKRLPSKKILIKRYVSTDLTLLPWKVKNDSTESFAIHAPRYFDEDISSMYELQFKLNRKFPLKEIFPSKKDRVITQNDFPAMIDFIEVQTDLLQEEVTRDLEKKANRKLKREERRELRRTN